MESTVSPMSNHVYILIRRKIWDDTNGIVQGTLLCHYIETNIAFLLGGLAQQGETLIAILSIFA